MRLFCSYLEQFGQGLYYLPFSQNYLDALHGSQVDLILSKDKYCKTLGYPTIYGKYGNLLYVQTLVIAKFKGLLNTSRYPYLDISGLQSLQDKRLFEINEAK